MTRPVGGETDGAGGRSDRPAARYMGRNSEKAARATRVCSCLRVTVIS